MIIDVADPSQIAAARRQSGDIARHLGADETTAGRVALVATEMATNLLKHAPGGRMAVSSYADLTGSGIEILSIDNGQGIGDIESAMVDGYSTAGTAGGGLGAIRRQADHFEIFSRPGQGTVVVARSVIKDIPAADATIGVVHAPYPGESLSGDGWSFARSTRGLTVIVTDGTGHGPLAESASRTAIELFHKHVEEDCAEILTRISHGLAHTRGAAIAIARFDANAGVIRYVGVGNIIGVAVANGATRHMVSHNGTVGLTVRRIQEFTYPVQRPVLVVLHSDGLSAKWDLATYPGLAVQHPSLIAGVLFRDYWRSRDDGIIVALRAE